MLTNFDIMPDELKWTLEDEANYFRQSYLDLRAQQERNQKVTLILIDFIAQHDKMLPAQDKFKLMQDLWKAENESQIVV